QAGHPGRDRYPASVLLRALSRSRRGRAPVARAGADEPVHPAPRRGARLRVRRPDGTPPRGEVAPFPAPASRASPAGAHRIRSASRLGTPESHSSAIRDNLSRTTADTRERFRDTLRRLRLLAPSSRCPHFYDAECLASSLLSDPRA